MTGKGRFASGFVVGKLARDIERSFRINRLYAGSSSLLGNNFNRLRNIPNVFYARVFRVLVSIEDGLRSECQPAAPHGSFRN